MESGPIRTGFEPVLHGWKSVPIVLHSHNVLHHPLSRDSICIPIRYSFAYLSDITTNAPPAKSKPRSKFTYKLYTCLHMRRLPTLRHDMNTSLVLYELYSQRCRGKNSFNATAQLPCRLFTLEKTKKKNLKCNTLNITASNLGRHFLYLYLCMALKDHLATTRNCYSKSLNLKLGQCALIICCIPGLLGMGSRRSHVCIVFSIEPGT